MQYSCCTFNNDVVVDRDGKFHMPWYSCYSGPWEWKQYGIGDGDSDGVYGQFPDAFSGEGGFEDCLDCVMEQIWAGELGFVEHPVPGFYECKQLRRIK